VKLLFVADPVDKLNPAGDSTLAMARAALRRGHEVLWATDQDLTYALDGCLAHVSRFSSGKRDVPATVATGTVRVRDLQGVFIRKDPPFDESYVRLCWFLSLEEGRVVQFNRASLLMRYHEKLLPLEGLAQGFLAPEDLIPTFIGARTEALAYFEKNGVRQVVTKPFLGFAGRDVELQDREAFRQSATSQAHAVIQPFAEEVRTKGDRRVIFLDGKVLGHFVRLPAKGGFISNLARGGSAHAEPMSAQEEKLCEKVGKFLQAAGIFFAGADFIGHRVSEINVTSPTGLRALEALHGSDGADAIIESWESKVLKKASGTL
jgi:glutathione synthase